MRKVSGYVTELPNHIDYISLFIKVIKLEFIYHLRDKKGYYNVTRIQKSTNDFFKEVQTLCFELCKIALVDGYTKRYLKSYIAASILLAVFEIEIDLMLKDTTHNLKYDYTQIIAISKIFEKVLSKYFGYNKYVFFQFIGKFLVNRFKCFFY